MLNRKNWVGSAKCLDTIGLLFGTSGAARWAVAELLKGEKQVAASVLPVVSVPALLGIDAAGDPGMDEDAEDDDELTDAMLTELRRRANPEVGEEEQHKT